MYERIKIILWMIVDGDEEIDFAYEIIVSRARGTFLHSFSHALHTAQRCLAHLHICIYD